jgi:hypothetical protein
MCLHCAPPQHKQHQQVCDTVSELGVELVDDAVPGGTSWPELLPTMFSYVQSGSPPLMEAALVVLGSLSSYMIDTLKPQVCWWCQYERGNSLSQ